MNVLYQYIKPCTGTRDSCTELVLSRDSRVLVHDCLVLVHDSLVPVHDCLVLVQAGYKKALYQYKLGTRKPCTSTRCHVLVQDSHVLPHDVHVQYKHWCTRYKLGTRKPCISTSWVQESLVPVQDVMYWYKTVMFLYMMYTFSTRLVHDRYKIYNIIVSVAHVTAWLFNQLPSD